MRGIISVLSVAVLLTAVSAAAEEAKPVDGEAKPADGEAKPANDKPGAGAQEAAADIGIKGSEPSATAKYGPAGCGLGSLVFDPGSGFTQIFAATTNGTSGNQTFGISSGTSNCDTGPGSSESAAAFVQTNRTALAKDISRGRGETISSLSELAGCSSDAAVGKRLQKNFKAIFPNGKVTDEQVSASVVSVLKSDETLSCTNLI